MVRILERGEAPSETGVEHWARVDFRPEPAPRVELDFANDTAGAGAEVSAQLTALGYRPGTAGQPAAAEGDAEAVYCREDERGAAFRLAAQTTRWLAQFPGMHQVIVAPRQDPACADGRARRQPARPAHPLRRLGGPADPVDQRPMGL